MAERVVPRLGMVGGGQLARMSCQAAIPLGLTLRVLAERADDSAALVAGDVEVGAPGDVEALRRFAAGCDVVTFDHELVPPEVLQALANDGVTLRPSSEALLFAQDKLHQRTRFAAAGLPVPAFAPIATGEDAAAFGAAHGWPVVLKATRGGYDGRGVWVARDAEDAQRIAGEVLASGVTLLAEAFVPIEREVAVLVARSANGQLAHYPVVETVQVDGMCREVLSPAPIPQPLASEAHRLAAEIATLTSAVGILALELFVTPSGLVVNEVALRPHNSGHFSIEGCATSQFENHIRAVLGWPLGHTTPAAPFVATVNVVGGGSGADPRANLPAALAVPGAHVHLYGKGPRPGRKLGHVTALGTDAREVIERTRRAAAMLVGE